MHIATKDRGENMARADGLTGFNKFTLLLIPFVWLYEASAVGPTLGEMSKAFPDASVLQIQLIMTLPFLSSIVFSVISGRLARTWDKKNLVLLGLLIYGVMGMSPALAHNVNQILILRLLTGVGVGLVLPLPNAIITEHFSEEKRERMLGLATAVCNIANIVASVVIGFVLMLGWRYPYYSFSLVLVIFVVALLGLPKSPPQSYAQSSVAKAQLPMAVWTLALFMALNFMFFGFVVFNTALFMTSEHLGAPWMIGITIALPATGSMLAGTVFPELTRLAKGYFVTLSLIVFACGFLLLYGAHSFVATLPATLLVGLGSGGLVPYILNLTADTVDAGQKDVAFGIVTGCIHFGYLVAPFAQDAISRVTNHSSYRFLFLVSAIITVVTAIIFSFSGGQARNLANTRL
jgi:MFS family permease